MARLQEVRTFASRRLNMAFDGNWGKTSVIEALKDIPHEIKRVFYIYESDLNITRGGHRLKKSIQSLICISGSYNIFIDDGENQQNVVLDKPSKILILEPRDWHAMTNTSLNSILLVISSQYYDPEEYVDEPYPTTPKDVVDKVYGGR